MRAQLRLSTMASKPVPIAAIAHAINANKRFTDSRAASAAEAAQAKPGFFSKLFSSDCETKSNPTGATGFFSKVAKMFANLRAEMQAELNKIQTTHASGDAALKKALYARLVKGALVLLCGLSLIGVLAVTIWIYVKYAKQSIQSLADDGEGGSSTLPYYKDVEYQAVISTSTFMSDYPVILVVVLSLLALIFATGLLVMILRQRSSVGAGAGAQQDSDPMLPLAIRCVVYSAYAFIASSAVVAYYHFKLMPFMDGIDAFNRYVKEHMCFNGNSNLLPLLTSPAEDVTSAMRAEIKNLADLESFTKAIFLANLYKYYVDAYKTTDRANALSNFSKLSAVSAVGVMGSTRFSDYINRKSSYIQNNADKILQNMKSEFANDRQFAAFLNNNKQKVIRAMEQKINELNSKGSCLGSIEGLSYFKSMISLLFFLILLLPVMMVIDWRITTAC